MAVNLFDRSLYAGLMHGARRLLDVTTPTSTLRDLLQHRDMVLKEARTVDTRGARGRGYGRLGSEMRGGGRGGGGGERIGSGCHGVGGVGGLDSVSFSFSFPFC